MGVCVEASEWTEVTVAAPAASSQRRRLSEVSVISHIAGSMKGETKCQRSCAASPHVSTAAPASPHVTELIEMKSATALLLSININPNIGGVGLMAERY